MKNLQTLMAVEFNKNYPATWGEHYMVLREMSAIVTSKSEYMNLARTIMPKLGFPNMQDWQYEQAWIDQNSEEV
jgi:hypothetical protein